MKHLYLFVLSVCICNVVSAQIPKAYGSLTEEFTGVTWDSVSRIWYEYDANEYEIRSTHQEYKPTLKQWFNSFKYESEYNAQGDEILEHRFSWNIGQMKWDTTGRGTRTYYKKGLVEAFKSETYSGTWETFIVDSNFYNANDKVIERRGYWDFTGNGLIWMNNSKHTFNASNKLTESLSFWRDTVNNVWDSTYKSVFSYNTTLKVDTITSYTYYAALGWQIDSRTITAFDSADRVMYYENLQWNSSNMDWDPSNRSRFTYHADGSTDVIYFDFYDNVEMDYVNYDKTTLLYGTPAGIDDQFNDQSILLYPNPVDEVLEIRLNGIFENTQALIYNSEGKLVQHELIKTGKSSINTNSWSPGNYIVVFPQHPALEPQRIIKR